MEKNTRFEKKLFGMNKARRKKFWFYLAFIAFPMLHYLVFYVYININSFILSFREYYNDDSVNKLVFKFSEFANFAEAFKILGEKVSYIWTSLLMLAIQLFVTTPLALLFSFYIYKKGAGTELFRVMLFLPSVLSAVVFGVLYVHISNEVIPWIQTELFHAEEGVKFLDNQGTQMFAVILFNILLGFGVSVLTYSGTMSGINISLIESAELDGANHVKEFFYIVVPMIWPTVVTLMIVSFSRVFTDQWQVYTLLSETASGNPVANLGYYLYVSALRGDFLKSEYHPAYSVLSALGLILTAIVLPLTLVMRWALNKFGPKAD